MCERVGVLYAGELVEEGPSRGRSCAIRATRTPSASCAASRAAACARTTAGSTRSPASCRRSGQTCPAACSSDRCALAAGHLPQRGAADFRVGGGHISRCHFHEQAQELPRATAEHRRSALRSTVATTPLLQVDDLAKIVPPATATTSTRSPGCRRCSGPARRSASSASRAAARRPSRARCSASSSRPRARSSSTAARSPTKLADAVGGGRARRCRSSSRTPTRRSTGGTRCGGSCAARCKKLAGRHAASAAETRMLGARSTRCGCAERYARGAPDAALRRPEAARRDRARVRRRAAARRLRRADLGARRLGAGGDPQPARRAAGASAASPTSSSRTTSASSATSPTGSPCSTSAG